MNPNFNWLAEFTLFWKLRKNHENSSLRYTFGVFFLKKNFI